MPPEQTPIARATITPLKLGKFAASRRIVSESFAILRQDKEIMWFPVLSFISSLVALAILVAVYFSIAGGFSEEALKEGGALNYAIVFVYYAVMFFILNFFQACILITAYARFNGQDMTFQGALSKASSYSGKILAWSLISATVGVILDAISRNFKIVGYIVASIMGAAWNILTYFSLPSLIIGEKSVTESFKESAAMIRKTWGETIIVNLGVGLFFMALTFVAAAVCIGFMVIVPELAMFIIMGALFVIFIVLMSIVSSALNTIFKLALYEYARTGKVPTGFSPELIENAIKVGKK